MVTQANQLIYKGCLDAQKIELIAKTHSSQSRIKGPHPALPLDLDVRACLPTSEAAHHLNRSPQTLRLWACHDTGPIRPIRINGRLMWPVADIKRLLGIGDRT
jgi:hypothetical protein